MIQYPTFAARDGQKSAQNGALPCWSSAEVENTLPTPPPATKPQISSAMLPPIRSGAEKDSNHFTPSMPVRMITSCIAQNTTKAMNGVPGNVRPAAPGRGHEGVEGRTAEPGLYPEPAAGDQRPGYRREVGPPHPERGADEDRERHAVLGAGVGVEEHRDQDDDVAQRDGQQRLPPVHPCGHEARGQEVGRDDYGHPDPERRYVVGRPRPLLRPRRRKVLVVQAAKPWPRS